MLISIRDFLQSFHLKIRGVIHVGAHKCQEDNEYKSCGIENILWFDANPEMCKNNDVKCYAVCDVSDTTVNFNVTSFDASSSMLNLGKHSTYYPEIVVSKVIEAPTIRLDDYLLRNEIPDGMYNMLSMDIQGAELLALKGLGEKLNQIDVIYTEVNTAELYQGCCLMSDLDTYVAKYGFKRVATNLTPQEWGDAIYVRTRVAATVRGGIGNQLYIFANLYAYAKRNGIKPVFDPRQVFHLHQAQESLWHKYPVLQNLFPSEQLSDKAQRYVENDRAYIPIPVFNNDVLLDGHFQSELYFADYVDEIKDIFRSLFAPTSPLPYIGIHTRRGDYLTNKSLHVLDETYYKRALTYLSDEQKIIIGEDPSLTWEKETIPGDVYQSGDAFEDFKTLMSCSKGLVLANSTFSWWTGYLNPYLETDKIVFPLDYYTDTRDTNYYRYVVPGWTYLTIFPVEVVLETVRRYSLINPEMEKLYRMALKKQVELEFTPEQRAEFEKTIRRFEKSLELE